MGLRSIFYFLDKGRLQIISSDYEPWAKPRITLEKRIFELGTPGRDSGLIPRNVWLISSVFRPKTYVHHRKNKIETSKNLIRMTHFV